MGGHVQMRVKDSRVNQAAPKRLTLAQVEFRAWFSLTGFGTYEGTGWLQRSDVLRSDEGVRHTWAKVNKEALPMPVYAPAFPGTPGAADNWTQLVEMVLDLYNTGKLPGFISTGSWPSDDALVFPTLAAVRDANLKALKRTPAACWLLAAHALRTCTRACTVSACCLLFFLCGAVANVVHGARRTHTHTHTRTHAHARLCRLSAPVTRLSSLTGVGPATAGAAAHQAAHMHAHKLSLSYLSHVHALYQLSLSLLPLLPL